MKNLFFTLALVLALANCDNEPVETNRFIGTWEAETGYKLIFTNTTVTGYKDNGDLLYEGTYTYNKTHITLNIDIETADPLIILYWGEIYTTEYAFRNGKLNFSVWWEKIN